jgi:hypothetical protein
LPCHAVGHRRDWDPGAQPPSVGAPEVRRHHVSRLI